MKRIRRIIMNVYKSICLINHSDKFYLIGIIVLRLFTAIENVLLYVYLPTLIIQQIEESKPLNEVLFLIVSVFCVISIFKFYIVWFREYYSQQSKEKIKINVLNTLASAMKNIDLHEYDDKEVYDKKINSLIQAETQVFNMVDNFGKLLQEIFTLFGIIALIFAFELRNILPIIFIMCMLDFLVGHFINKKTYKFDYEMNVLTKKDSYIQRIFYMKNFAKELRTSNIFKVIAEQFWQNAHKKISYIKKHFRITIGASFFINFITKNFLIYGIVPLFIIYTSSIDEGIHLINFVVIFNTTQKIITSIESLLNKINNISQSSTYFDLYREFIDKYEKKNVIIEYLNKPITMLKLTNLSYKYDGEQIYALKNINLQIENKAKIAIVGENGSGKSTLTKILMGLYVSSQGEYMINNSIVDQNTASSIHKEFTYIPQNSNIYAASIAENVALDSNYNIDRVFYALNKSNLFNGKNVDIEQNISKEFDFNGLELSGGQLQKLVFARVYYQNKDVIILDEPTSMIDPIAEYDMYKKLLDELKDKIVIFVTHRLYCAKIMDRIIMLHNGEIIADGTHKELMKNNQYNKLYNAQYKRYLNGDY